MGPDDAARAASAASLLMNARALAHDAGVTRLADITRLDRIGLPVWQAIRPMSRALSVHQGKGASQADAQLGALLEAAESHAAEQLECELRPAAWQELDANKRPSRLGDYARHRDAPPREDTPYAWIEARTHDGREALVPFDCASLDFTRPEPSPFERSSAGLATGSTQEEARRTALHELIERDALRGFLDSDMFERLEQEIMPSSVPFIWFSDLEERISAAGGTLRLFRLPSVTGSPVIAASIRDESKDALPYRAIVGHAAHQNPETALFKAVAEAVQSRLTFIAASRDDCLPALYDDPTRAMSFAFASPPNSAVRPRSFEAIDEGPTCADDLVDALGKAGFEEVIHLPLQEALGFFIQRSFVPGLGSMARARR